MLTILFLSCSNKDVVFFFVLIIMYFDWLCLFYLIVNCITKNVMLCSFGCIKKEIKGERRCVLLPGSGIG